MTAKDIMRLPTEKEINVYDSPDEILASRNFLNKTLADAEEMFKQDSARFQEDLMWMGPVAFSFYLRAVLNYLRDDSSPANDEFIYALYGILAFRSDEPEFRLALETARSVVEYILDHFEKFDVDPGIYGDLERKYRQLRDRFGSLTGTE